ncbi:hypothetical protein HF086_004948 [Spodoptera exigua]|uniref:Transcription factor DP C-terminal domain-containing protein n=1 Tax=Spodoptera exigua TaxID=7107 RepID=A0A922S9I4_SPOEX|nr:hypothetical protein HF086_004948 [Spodoptera exigua]
MSQTNSTVNFLIHDANGHPQMVKVVQNTNNQSLAQLKIKPNPVKIIKLPASAEGINKTSVYRAVKLTGIKCASKFLQVDNLPNLQAIKVEPKDPEEENQAQPEPLSELKYIQAVPDLSSIPTKSDNLVTSTGNSLSPAMSHASRRRHDSDNDPPAEYTTKRRKHADKVGKGLRHFSMKVCEKVRNKGFTSYNEVADELVLEFAAGMHGSADSQHISFKSLIERNKEAESKGVKPSPSSAIHLPFIVVNTSDKALIDCSISNDKTEYMFNFNKRFQIHDDIDILKRMGLLFGLDKGECSEEDIERAKKMGRGVITKLSTMLEEGDLDDEGGEEDDAIEGEAEGEEEQEEAEGNEYSDDSSDVDV